MIYKSGKEIKEIYIGDTPVTAVYIGNKLVWRSYVYFKTTGTAVYIPQSDVDILNSHGITYSFESSVLPFTVYASPYMRHISPMTAANEFFGNAEGLIKVSHSELVEADRNAASIHNASAVCAKGEGEAPRCAYLSEGMQCVPIVHGYGEAVKPAHVSNAQAAVNSINADGKPENAGKFTSLPIQYVDKALKVSADFIKGAAKWTASAEVKARDNATIEASVPRGIFIPSENAAAKVGTGDYTSVSGIMFGSCSSSMTTEIYTEPLPSSFDSSMIAELDGLALADIDAMSVSA